MIAQENYYLEKWLHKMVAANKKPDLGLDIHNDAGGNLHVSRPDGDITAHFANMANMDSLLRKYTFFTAGSTKPGFRKKGRSSPGTS